MPQIPYMFILLPHSSYIWSDFRQKRLQFRPPLEEIRAKYYREMKKFISLPYHFRGLADSGDDLIFPVIIEKHTSGFSTVYRKAEELFQRLAKAQNVFKASCFNKC